MKISAPIWKEDYVTFLKALIRAGSMGIEKVIKLVIKIFTWFYQKWISTIKIKSANKTDLKKIQYLASALVFSQKPNIFQSLASVFQC